MQNLSVARNAQYTSPHIAEEMQQVISECIEEKIDDLISNSPFLSFFFLMMLT